ncbi:MAG TPA: 50S ribosomal protein L25/general stress protein Ctc [Vitreimonas sp.]|uniref:50S ribosomal protein L25/general stress protein Ctc n=1 Tax=Vitreimonas sp. TaxID=3069702 RepID=UPI002D4C3725|nr:50S ribosomal protein L25/general stress protein Ctc [Vitreimonas sp.]HYD86671.1 50S ribosomal protein L25/general stress protein Ctc [Vitreimonas sp.]
MAGIVLNVEKRERTGTGGARATRNSGLIPGVLYGGPRGAVPIEINAKDVQMALRSGKFVSHMVELNHQGETQPVIPRAIQFHPVTDEPIHIDLYRVEENSEIDIDVVVHFKNHEASPGLKRGGALNIVRHTIKLRCKASKIPEEIVVDLTGKEIGDSIHISSIALPEGARPVIRDRDFTVATIAGRKAEVETTETPAEGAAAPAEGEKKEG